MTLKGLQEKWGSNFSLVTVLAVSLALFHLYTAQTGLLTPVLQRGYHLYTALILIFIIKAPKKEQTILRVLNWGLILVVVAVGSYMILYATPERLRALALVGITGMDRVVGGILILLVLEGARRMCGLPLTLIAVAFLLYGYFGPHLPGLLAHRGYSVERIIEQTSFTLEGIYGIPLGVAATFIVLFVIFGAFLETSGAGKFFIDTAYALTGRGKSGPAMTAVVSSSFMGSINGVAAANVVTTGAFTIPLMKKVGYTNVMAGAIEAAASTGGQILPPVMGAAAFIMAEIMGISYVQVAIAAAVPALLYFVSVGYMVHLEAVKRGLKGLKKSELPDLKSTLIDGLHFIIPIIALIYFLLIIRFTPTKSALYAVIFTFAASMVRRSSRMNLITIIKALELGIRNTLVVSAACSTAGIVIGIVTMTGLGLRFSGLINVLSGGILFIALLLTAITCIILGMGLPTSAAYIVTATLGAPVLMNLGVEPIAAHLFILYYAVVSVITPPVAIAAYAASGLADENPLKIALQATRMGIAAYIIPFIFVYGPSLLLIGSPYRIIISIITALFGTFILASAVQGYFIVRLDNYLLRAILLASSLALITTNIYYNLAGIAGIILIGLLQVLKRNKLQEEEIPDQKTAPSVTD